MPVTFTPGPWGTSVDVSPADCQGTVWVLRYSHKHGDDILAFTSLDLASDALAAIAREWWDDITGIWDEVPETPDGLSDEATIEMYFDHQDDESWSIENIAIMGTSDVTALVGKDA